MFADERQQLIAGLARRDGRVVVAALASELEVAAETIRRDLDALEAQGVVRRVHGGAVPAEDTSGREAPVAQRTEQAADAKARIAEAALALLPAGRSAIVLDAGTTTAALASRLPARDDLTVITNAVPIAARLGDSHPGEVTLLGGRVRGVTQATVGQTAVAQLALLRTDAVFLGTDGLTAAHGLSTPDGAESAVKAAMARTGRAVHVLADASKVGRELLHSFAPLADVDTLITDDSLDPDLRAAVESAGVEVVLA